MFFTGSFFPRSCSRSLSLSSSLSVSASLSRSLHLTSIYCAPDLPLNNTFFQHLPLSNPLYISLLTSPALALYLSCNLSRPLPLYICPNLSRPLPLYLCTNLSRPLVFAFSRHTSLFYAHSLSPNLQPPTPNPHLSLTLSLFLYICLSLTFSLLIFSVSYSPSLFVYLSLPVSLTVSLLSPRSPNTSCPPPLYLSFSLSLSSLLTHVISPALFSPLRPSWSLHPLKCLIGRTEKQHVYISEAY